MADDHQTGLPGAEIVEQYAAGMRDAITDGISAGVQAGVKEVKDDLRRTLARWAAGTIFVAILAAALVTRLVYPPSRGATDWVVHHADGLYERCVLQPDPSPDNEAKFVCRLAPPIAPGVPASPQGAHP